MNRWPLVPLGEVCDHVATEDPRRNARKRYGYLDISGVDNTSKSIRQIRMLLGEEAPTRARQLIQPGDVVVATTRPNLNAVALVEQFKPELGTPIASTGFCILRPGPRVLSSWLFAFVRSATFVEAVSDLVQGAMYPAVSDRQVLEQCIPLPPLDEQRRIVGRLEAQFAAVDKLANATQSQAKDITDLIDQAIDSELHHESDSCVPLAQLLAAPLSAGLSKPEDATSPYRGLTLGAVRGRDIDYSASKPVQASAREAFAKQMEPRTLYVVRGNGNVNLVGRGAATGDAVPPNTIYPDLLIRVKPDESKMALDYFKLVWHTRFVREQIVASARTAAGIYKINQQNLSAVLVPVPDVSTQRQRAERAEHLYQASSDTSLLQTTQLKAVADLRQALLRETFA